METIFKRRPWLVPVTLAVLTLILFRPVIIPQQPGEVLNGQDLRGMFYPLQEFIRVTLQNGELPLWNPYMFLGVPNIGNPHSSLFYPGTWLVWLIGTQRGIGIVLVLHTWLGAWGMARLMRNFGASYTGSLLAGVVYAMSGWTGARYYIGHHNLMLIHGWIPWALLAYRHALARRTWTALLPGIGVIGATLLAGHPPLTVYMIMALIALWLWDSLQDEAHTLRRAWENGWRLAAIGLGGAVLGAVMLLPTAELTRLADRDPADLAFANKFALPAEQLLSALVLPDLYGNPTVEPYYYWGSDFYEEFTAYVGLLPLLAIPLVFRWRRRENWFFLGLIAFGIVYSLGIEGVLLPLMVRWVPGSGLFRVPARSLLLTVIGLAGLLALLVTELQTRSLDERREVLQLVLKRWLPIAITLAFGLGLFFSGWFASASHVEPMPQRAREVAGALTKAGLIGCGIWFVLWLWTQTETAATQWALRLTVLLVMLDAWHVAIPIITTGQVHEAAIWTGARTNIPADDSGRVLKLLSSTAPTNTAFALGLKHINAYDSLSPETFIKLQELTDAYDPTARMNTLFGVKYVLAPEPFDNDEFELIGIAYDSFYYERKNPFPRVWYPAEVIVQPNDDAVRAALVDSNTDLQQTVFTDQTAACAAGSGTAAITDYNVNDLTITTQGDGGLLVLTDQYYPGWEARIDGEKTDIIRADTAFRAVCVPAGEHTIIFEYRPMSLYAGVALSGAGWLLWLITSLFAGWRARKTRQQPGVVPVSRVEES